MMMMKTIMMVMVMKRDDDDDSDHDDDDNENNSNNPCSLCTDLADRTPRFNLTTLNSPPIVRQSGFSFPSLRKGFPRHVPQRG